MVAVLLGWPAQAFVATVVYAPSGGMQPTVHAGDRMLVDRVAFHLTGLHRGDIVVVRVTRDGVRSPALKRILGLPGDQISCTDGVVHRNGAVVAEPYLAPGSSTQCPATRVGPGQLFLLGDDRTTSLDSRQYGTVAESAVLGRVLTRVWRGQI